MDMVYWKFAALLATLSGFLLSFSGITIRTDATSFWKSLRPIGWVALSLVVLGILSGSVLILLERERDTENKTLISEEKQRAHEAELERAKILEELTGLQETIGQVVQREQQTIVKNQSEARQELSNVKTILNSAISSKETTIQVEQEDSFCSTHLLFGAPSKDNQYQFCRRGYALSFNLSTNVADWVTYVIDPKLANQRGIRRPRGFFLDPTLPAGRGPDNRIYVQNSYDRGHLVFSKDFSASPELRKEAYLYSAVAPQADKMNRGAWLEAELLSHNAAIEKNRKILIYSGPIMPPGPIRYYRDMVVLPIAYFRIMVDTKSLASIAVIIPNENDPPPRRGDLSHYLVTIDEIESKTGLDFLQSLDDKVEAQIEAVAALKAVF